MALILGFKVSLPHARALSPPCTLCASIASGQHERLSPPRNGNISERGNRPVNLLSDRAVSWAWFRTPIDCYWPLSHLVIITCCARVDKPHLALSPPREKVHILLKDFINSKLPNLRVCVTSRSSILNPLTFRSLSLHDAHHPSPA